MLQKLMHKHVVPGKQNLLASKWRTEATQVGKASAKEKHTDMCLHSDLYLVSQEILLHHTLQEKSHSGNQTEFYEGLHCYNFKTVSNYLLCCHTRQFKVAFVSHQQIKDLLPVSKVFILEFCAQGVSTLKAFPYHTAEVTDNVTPGRMF